MMSDDVVTIAEFAQFVRRIDERFKHMDERFASMRAEMAEFRAELRSQRVLMMVLHGPVAVGAAVVIVGTTAKFVFS